MSGGISLAKDVNARVEHHECRVKGERDCDDCETLPNRHLILKAEENYDDGYHLAHNAQ